MAFACLRTFLYILLNFITFCKSEPARDEEAGRPSKDGFKRNLAALSHQQENIVGNGIPEGLKCVEVPWCDSSGVCSRVCQRGSVKLDPWFKWAMQYQLRMSDKLPMCLSQALATHNSGISIADGYGNRDRIYSNYLAWLDVLGGNHKVQTNNQWVSLTDQLNMGVRFIELDVHFVAGELRIAHCGGFHSKPLNRIVSMINVVARMLGRSELAWDTETVGCSPSLSSIPVSDQRLFRDSVSEVADWLAMPENSKEVLMIILDNQRDLSAWGKVPGMLNQILESIPQTLILTPPEVLSMRKCHSDTSNTVWESPSIEALRRLGKRVVLLSGSDFGSEMDSLIFSNLTFASLCPYSEAWMRHWQLNPSWDQEDQNLQQSITNLDESFKVSESAESDMNHGDPSSVDDDDMSSSGP
ncbi:hypothetical protein CEUSTIGMA_g2295.t1 [Chlamydomonas eustigma]|uniref:Phosphatidylinositol-specific phospholipase C X domain-containing protein n=1 Tax=Chlamydomonas eustigma TaxID=1157962 RepID=A0A250WVW7_9CHLO|nr:hypothetical protein CEUSTIGMA_g2295.t1 [Chlamydomonas eustigma]|eukprot:GAX74849.1 hypothetical protein CEUSTIGMA_g2295.t1 [Chlamydomonas eustigma]